MNPLQRASEYLFRPNGWGKNHLCIPGDGHPAYCLVGAINIAARGNPELRVRAKQIALGQVLEQYPDMFGDDAGIPVHEATMDECLTLFNDTRYTKEPVIRILQKAALEWTEF